MQRLVTKRFCISDFGCGRWSGTPPLDWLPAKAEGAPSTHWWLRMHQPLISFSPPAEAVCRGVATVIPNSFLGARSESWVLGEDQCSRPSQGMLLSGLQRYYLSPDTQTCGLNRRYWRASSMATWRSWGGQPPSWGQQASPSSERRRRRRILWLSDENQSVGIMVRYHKIHMYTNPHINQIQQIQLQPGMASPVKRFFSPHFVFVWPSWHFTFTFFSPKHLLFFSFN